MFKKKIKPKTDLGNQYNKPFKLRFNLWLWRNIFYIILVGCIGVWVLTILVLIQCGYCMESTKEQHIQNFI